MATAKNGRHTGKHRASQMPVRRWLHLGAASAGVGAAMVGWSLVAGAGVATADVEGSSPSTGSAASQSAGVQSGSSGANSTASRGDSESRGPSTTPRRAARTATDAGGSDENTPSQVVSRANRAAAAENVSVADRFTNATNLNSRVASRAAAPAGTTFDAVVSAFTPRSAAAQPATAPGAKVTWKFVYTDGAEEWTPEYRRELEQSAAALSAYFQAPVPITITYEVKAGDGDDDDDDDDDDSAANDGLLARASSPPTSKAPGYYNTVLQEKFISGLDLNGPEYDGDVEFNFDNDWGLGYKVDDEDYDFVSTAMHEMMHSLGFLSNINEPGKNTKDNWATFDRYLVDDQGNHPIGPDYRFDQAFNADLVGLTGMYFGGPNAVAAFGRPVPLWTPYPFAEGTSMSHLDANVFSGANVQMMNPDANKTGNDRRFLSLIEQGIMADLGYRVNFQAPAPYAPATTGN